MRNKVCTVSTVKAPVEQVKSWVNYHLNSGINHMFIFFDDSKDKTIKEIEKYPPSRVSCFRCDREHWEKFTKEKNIPIEKKQRINSKIALEKAKKMNFEWIAHIDSDELIYYRGNIKKTLFKTKKEIDFIRFPTLEAVPERINYGNRLEEVNLFKRNFGKISKKYFKGNISGKSLTRVSNKIENLGIHVPEAKKDFKLNYKFSIKGRILHFDCAGFGDWKEKWKNRLENKTIAIEMGDIRKKIISEFARCYKEGNEEKLVELYKKQFFIFEPLKTFLKVVGVLKKIKINPKLFEKPKNA